MLNAIAIDDEPLALEIIRAHAAKVPFINLKAEFTDAFKAMEYLQHEPADLLFLDIKMPDISGIDLLNCLSKKPLVIFTTAYSEHAVESFNLDAIDFLLKPFSQVRFIRACNKANELFMVRNASDAKGYLFIKDGFDQVKIQFDEIQYLEATGNYVTFAMKEKRILSRMTISECQNLLPANKFIRIHRSFIVALNKIDKMERHQLHINGSVIPIGSTYADSLIKQQR